MPDSSSNILHFELASEYVLIEDAVERTEAFLRRHIENDDLLYRVLLPVSEAVTNGMRHGNKMDADKQVRVHLRVEPSVVEVLVEDEGEGFDPERLNSPVEEDNLLKEGGRGIYLIESMADSVIFEEEGRRIRMRFQREEAPT